VLASSPPAGLLLATEAGEAMHPLIMTGPAVAELLVCPRCRGALAETHDAIALECPRCTVAYPIEHGIPILVPPDLQSGRATDEALEDHKARQIAYFDTPPEDDFGVTRPRGAPALYEYLLRDKFRRSVMGLENVVRGSTVLVVCGGSGFDAELLVEAGARVIVSDISLGVLLQAQERSRRFGLGFVLVVADVEALPFADHSIDVVYVHDGLHHLERPDVGLTEMARVARRALSISEPARSLASGIAVRLGVAAKREEAGNPVARLDLDELERTVRSCGFRPLYAHRYAMFYRHWPGPAMNALSHPAFAPIARRLYALANRSVGRFGNKLTVQAIREGAMEPLRVQHSRMTKERCPPRSPPRGRRP
jgi:SAM-dependent methyltransferase